MTKEERKDLRITELECLMDALEGDMDQIDVEINEFCDGKDVERIALSRECGKAKAELDKLSIPSVDFLYEVAEIDMFGVESI